MSKGFVSSSYLNKIKPPYITGVLTLIGVIITAFGFGMLTFNNDPAFTLIPYTTSLLGVVLVVVTLSYFLIRRWGINQAKIQEESSFRDWVENHHGLKLTEEQTDQLYNYGTTVVNGTTYFTQKDFTPEGNTRIFVAKEHPTDLLETGVIVLPDLKENESDPLEVVTETSEKPQAQDV